MTEQELRDAVNDILAGAGNTAGQQIDQQNDTQQQNQGGDQE